jgi:hypothetical protein
VKNVILALLVFSLLWVGCDKEITVDLPKSETFIVVEGSIDINQPPIIFLSRSQGYFDPLTLDDLANFYICDAVVTLKANNATDTLLAISAATLSPEQLQQVSQMLGISPEQLSNSNICAYTTLNPAFWGHVNTQYQLDVYHEGKHVYAKTKLNNPIPLDSLWFASPNGNSSDSLGFIYATLTDPDTLGNCYRWAAKRINHYPNWAPDPMLRGQIKDRDFVRPFNSVTNDDFFNGLTFDFSYYRGTESGSEKFDDTNEEAGFYKRGDTIVVKGQSVDYPCFQYIYDIENANGGPFALPYNLRGNVVGGLGAFIAYGSYIDTLICQ